MATMAYFKKKVIFKPCLALLSLCLFNLSFCVYAVNISWPENKDDPLISFALTKVKQAIKQPKQSLVIKNISLTLDEKLTEQSFQLRSNGHNISLVGADSSALMYGLLELKEQIEFNQNQSADHFSPKLNISQTPFIKKRGLKFNIPLDARTPSYDDTGDSAQQNIATVWDITFWQAYLDRMAEHRYNQLTLWNPQPFTSMLKLAKYPGLALDDVYVSNAALDKKVGVWGEAGGVSPLVLTDLRKVKTLTITEKITFWRAVMRYAKHRGVDVHFVTWSIYTNSINGAYGIDDDIDNPNTIAFFREAVKELVLTYTDLKGIGIIAGERMPSDGEVENWSREKWLWQTYGLGLQDAKKINPTRQIDFMHRFWYSGYADIAKYWGDYRIIFRLVLNI
ncbi:MAG: hypothetical protein ACSHW0_08690 [Thalassotalea sp.]